jgi:hypothetical protein
VRAPLQQVEESTATVSMRLADVRSGLDQMVQRAQSGGGPLERQLADQLLALVDQTIGPRYDRLRSAYVDLRDRVTVAAQALASLQRVVPFIQLPSLPLENLTALDNQLQEFDTNLQQMRASLSAGVLPATLPGVDALRGVAAQAQQMSGAVDTMAGYVDNLQARAAQGIAQVDATQAAAEQVLTVLASALTIVCVYMALLHAAVFAFGRMLRQPVVPRVLTAGQSSPDGQSRTLIRPETVA